jgi:hypothetical protein
MKLLVAVLAATLAAPAYAGDDPAPALLGSGLLTLQDTRTLRPGHVTAATTLHNRDRDPLGIDVFDYSMALTVGITPKLEAYTRGVYSRVVVVPDVSNTWPVMPPPPLDLVVGRDRVVPERPYYPLYAGMPYANGRGDQRFSHLVPGDLVFGAKRRLRDGIPGRASLAVSAEMTVPLTRRLNALQSGAGTGGIDATIRLTSEWRLGRFDLVATGAFTRVGAPYLGDRIIVADENGAEVVQEPLRLPHRIEIGGGVRRPLSSRFAVVGEMVATLETAGGTRTLDAAPPLDLLGGFQARLGGVRLTAGILYSARSLATGDVHATPLAGYVDLSRVSETDVREYLEHAGLAGAAGTVRPGVQVVTPPRPGVALPRGARVIPDTYTIESEHQLGFTLVLGWAF